MGNRIDVLVVVPIDTTRSLALRMHRFQRLSRVGFISMLGNGEGIPLGNGNKERT